MENKTITITTKDFDDAVHKAIDQTVKDLAKRDNVSDFTVFLIPMIGSHFALSVRHLLFDEKEEELSECHDDTPPIDPLPGLF